MPALSYGHISSRLTPSILGDTTMEVNGPPMRRGVLSEASNVKTLNAKAGRQIQVTGKNP